MKKIHLIKVMKIIGEKQAMLSKTDNFLRGFYYVLYGKTNIRFYCINRAG